MARDCVGGGGSRANTIDGVRRILLILLVATSLLAGAKRLGDTARLARELGKLDTLEERRARLFGNWYVAMQQLRHATPNDATIDFVMLHAEGRDIAVLAAAELQPRDVRLFDGWDAWKRRSRAELLHDARAANAAPGPLPGPAQFVVAVDPTHEPPLRLLTNADEIH
jgi:hypothetical protein